MDYECILYEKANRIAYITLNRPDKLNALSSTLRVELADAVKKAEKDEEVNVLVLKGAGRAFSAGYDLAERPAMGYGSIAAQALDPRRDIDRMMDGIVNIFKVLWECRKPIISQVQGYCLAGGTDCVLHTDIIVCAEDAQFGFPAARAVGTLPTHMWTYNVGPQWAKYMLCTGNSIDGKTAERIGLVWKAVPAEELEDEVNQLAETMAKIPYALLAVHKRIVNITLELMGRTLLQQLAAEGDAISHQDPIVAEFRNVALTQGVKAAFEWMNRGFGDYGYGISKEQSAEAGEKK